MTKEEFRENHATECFDGADAEYKDYDDYLLEILEEIRKNENMEEDEFYNMIVEEFNEGYFGALTSLQMLTDSYWDLSELLEADDSLLELDTFKRIYKEIMHEDGDLKQDWLDACEDGTEEDISNELTLALANFHDTITDDEEIAEIIANFLKNNFESVYHVKTKHKNDFDGNYLYYMIVTDASAFDVG